MGCVIEDEYWVEEYGKDIPDYSDENCPCKVRVPGPLAYGDYTSLGIGIAQDGTVLITACGEGTAMITPKFCPFCGRKLSDKIRRFGDAYGGYDDVQKGE